MRRFRFKFETLEKVRKAKESECLRLLSLAQSAYRDAVAVKDSRVSELEAALIRRESLGIEPIGVDAFVLENDFITGTKQRIIQADQSILRAKRGVEKALRAYLQARRETRVTEVLREKAYAEFRTARAKQEQRDLDDLYVMRAAMTVAGRESA